jgi:hypothetical protein
MIPVGRRSHFFTEILGSHLKIRAKIALLDVTYKQVTRSSPLQIWRILQIVKSSYGSRSAWKYLQVPIGMSGRYRFALTNPRRSPLAPLKKRMQPRGGSLRMCCTKQGGTGYGILVPLVKGDLGGSPRFPPRSRDVYAR